MGIKEDVLALADDVESTIGGCYGCLLDKRGLCKAESDFDRIDEVCKFVANRLRGIVEDDAESVTTVSAYDLLPEDEREAIAWVREHGGLDLVKAFVHQGAVEHGFLLKIAEMLGISIYDGTDNADALLDKLDKRLMPEGMGWPKVDGEPVDFKTFYGPSLGVLEAVSIYNNGACEVMSHDGIVKNATEIHVFKPKVVDADGVEVGIGDKLYDTETGCARIVRAINASGTVEFEGYENSGWFTRFLTHRAPVLGADGKPLQVGETVWAIGDALTSMQVLEIKPSDDPDESEHLVWCGETWGESLNYAKKWRIAGQLTHTKPEPPDSWERIEEDATRMPGEYCERYGIYGDSFLQAEAMACDLVRRCRALAERGQ